MNKKKLLENLLSVNIKRLMSGEAQINNYLPSMIEKSRSYELRNALITQQEQVQQHIERLETVLELLETKKNDPDLVNFTEKNYGMGGLIDEAKQLESHSELSDFTLAASGHLIQQYEIGCYTQAIILAQQLKYHAIETLLAESLVEDKALDQIYSRIEHEELKTTYPRPIKMHMYIKNPNFL